MIELKPMTLATLGLGVVVLVISTLWLPDGESKTMLLGLGGWLVGLVMRGPGLTTHTEAAKRPR